MRITKFVSEVLLSRLFPVILLSVFLSACGSDGGERPDYLDANTIKSLEIPPKLTTPDTRGALRLPEPAQKNAAEDKNKVTQNTPIAPDFNGFELKNNSRLYWLEVDMPVDDLWAMLPRFLASEGIEVDRVERLLGFIDTSWMNEYKASYNSEESSSSWFSGFSPDYKDRFRLRVEAVPGNKNKSRMYVSHRGLEISVSGDDSDWVQRDSEPFMEREMLYRFVLFAGISKSGATEMLSQYSSYQPRVNKVTEQTDEFSVKGDEDTVWLRLQTAVERLGVDIIESDRASNTLIVRVGDLQAPEKLPEDETGWFSGLFSGKDVVVDEYDGYENEPLEESPKKKYKIAPEDRINLKLVLTAEKDLSKIKMTNEDGSAVSDDLAWAFRDALLEQLK
jgi:uncharacterized lipoprotein